jgi:hypothetical protein
MMVLSHDRRMLMSCGVPEEFEGGGVCEFFELTCVVSIWTYSLSSPVTVELLFEYVHVEVEFFMLADLAV